MSEQWNAPSWLQDALAHAQPASELVGDFDAIQSGQIRVLRDMDFAVDQARLVFVLEHEQETGTALVAQATPEVEYAGEGDFRLSANRGGRLFELLVETDVSGSVWVSQLGSVFATAPQSVASALLAVSNGAHPHEVDLPIWRFGLPVRERKDARWAWKHQELDAFNVLAHECIEWLAEGALMPSFVDPEAVRMSFDAASTPDQPPIDMIEAIASGKESVPPDMLEDLLGLVDSVGPDIQIALQPLIDASLALASSQRSAHSEPAAWGPREYQEGAPRERLGGSLAAAAGDVLRCIRLTTLGSLWGVEIEGEALQAVLLTRLRDNRGIQVALSCF